MSKDYEIGRKIGLLRASLGESQEDFGKRFGVEQATISRWEKGDPVARKHQAAMAALAGMTVPDFFYSPEPPRLVPVVAEIASDSFEILPSIPGQKIEPVRLEIGGADQVSVRVIGKGMLPAYGAGDTLIGPRLRGSDIEQALRRDCIVRTTSGQGFVRILMPGSIPGKYNLRSFDPMEDDEIDAELDWAAPVKIVLRA